MTERYVLVVGAGIVGITTAQRLARNNIKVYLVERLSYIGGQALSYNCIGVENCNKCSVCLLQRRIKELQENPSNIFLKINSTIKDVKKDKSKFEITLIKSPLNINPELCQGCGLCEELCPYSAISISHAQSFPRSYTISRETCLNFKKKDSCNICIDACPFGAINFDSNIEKETLSDISAIILATGFEPWDPTVKTEYGYGENKNVITASDFKHEVYTNGHILRPSDKKKPKKIAIIQCVGSRDRSVNNQNCSRVCCGYGIQMGRLLKEENPEIEVSIFYMDIQPFGKEFNKTFNESKKDFNIQYLKSIPSQIIEDKEGRVILKYEDPRNSNIEKQNFDLAILSIASNPAKKFGKLAEKLNLWVNDNGFCEIPNYIRGNKTNKKGIFVAGTSLGPKDISECIANAENAALEVMLYLKKQYQDNK